MAKDAAICTNGPSLPMNSPLAIEQYNAIILAITILKFRYLYILIPAKIDFNSGIPLPYENISYEFTSASV